MASHVVGTVDEIRVEGPQDWTATGATVRIELPARVITGWQTSLDSPEKRVAPERETVR